MYTKKLAEKIKEHFQEVLKTKTSAHSIALGFAIGTFLSIIPTPGLNFIIGLLIIFIFEKVNKYSLFAGILFWNPLISIPIYYFSYRIGDLIFGSSPTIIYELALIDKVYFFARRFLVGNIILAFSFSTTSYFIIKKLVESYYKKEHSEKNTKHN